MAQLPFIPLYFEDSHGKHSIDVPNNEGVNVLTIRLYDFIGLDEVFDALFDVLRIPKSEHMWLAHAPV